MSNYFVVFQAEFESKNPINDVIEYSRDISNVNDIRYIERIISDKWFGDDREIILINYKKV